MGDIRAMADVLVDTSDESAFERNEQLAIRLSLMFKDDHEHMESSDCPSHLHTFEEEDDLCPTSPDIAMTTAVQSPHWLPSLPLKRSSATAGFRDRAAACKLRRVDAQRDELRRILDAASLSLSQRTALSRDGSFGRKSCYVLCTEKGSKDSPLCVSDGGSSHLATVLSISSEPSRSVFSISSSDNAPDQLPDLDDEFVDDSWQPKTMCYTIPKISRSIPKSLAVKTTSVTPTVLERSNTKVGSSPVEQNKPVSSSLLMSQLSPSPQNASHITLPVLALPCEQMQTSVKDEITPASGVQSSSPACSRALSPLCQDSSVVLERLKFTEGGVHPPTELRQRHFTDAFSRSSGSASSDIVPFMSSDVLKCVPHVNTNSSPSAAVLPWYHTHFVRSCIDCQFIWKALQTLRSVSCSQHRPGGMLEQRLLRLLAFGVDAPLSHAVYESLQRALVYSRLARRIKWTDIEIAGGLSLAHITACLQNGGSRSLWLAANTNFGRIHTLVKRLRRAVIADDDMKVIQERNSESLQKLVVLSVELSRQPSDSQNRVAIELVRSLKRCCCVVTMHRLLLTLQSPPLRLHVLQRYLQDECGGDRSVRGLRGLVDAYFHCHPPLMSASECDHSPSKTTEKSQATENTKAEIVCPVVDRQQEDTKKDRRNMTSHKTSRMTSRPAGQQTSYSKESCEILVLFLWILLESYIVCNTDNTSDLSASSWLSDDDITTLLSMSEHVNGLHGWLNSLCNERLTERTRTTFIQLECLSCIAEQCRGTRTNTMQTLINGEVLQATDDNMLDMLPSGGVKKADILADRTMMSASPVDGIALDTLRDVTASDPLRDVTVQASVLLWDCCKTKEVPDEGKVKRSRWGEMCSSGHVITEHTSTYTKALPVTVEYKKGLVKSSSTSHTVVSPPVDRSGDIS